MTLEKIDQEMYFWNKLSHRLPFDLQGAVVVILCAFSRPVKFTSAALFFTRLLPMRLHFLHSSVDFDLLRVFFFFFFF